MPGCFRKTAFQFWKIGCSHYLEPPEVPIVSGGGSPELLLPARATLGINSNKLKAT